MLFCRDYVVRKTTLATQLQERALPHKLTITFSVLFVEPSVHMAAVKQQESTSSPDWTRIGVSATLSGLLVVRSWRRKSLTRPGCIAAFGVGYLTASSGWIPFAAKSSPPVPVFAPV